MSSVLTVLKKHSPILSYLLPLLFTTFMCGCGEQRAAPVDPEKARATLITVLDHWKEGGVMEELRARDPEIVVQEMLWSNGRELLSYEFIGEGRVEDANLFCEVELTLAPKGDGDPEKKKLTYVIGTDPVLTVFRAIL